MEYRIEGEVKIIYDLEVNADNLEQAINKAKDIVSTKLEGSNDGFNTEIIDIEGYEV